MKGIASSGRKGYRMRQPRCGKPRNPWRMTTLLKGVFAVYFVYEPFPFVVSSLHKVTICYMKHNRDTAKKIQKDKHKEQGTGDNPMGKIITIASQKGGVGKTTTALNLGYSLGRFGARVVILDSDPQGGIGISTNLKKVTSLGLINFLQGTTEVKDIVKYTKDRTMAIVGIGTDKPEDVLLLEKEAQNGNLGKSISTLAENVDYVIIDAPAGIGGLVNALFKASSSILIVLNSRILTLKTLPIILKMLTYSQKDNPDLRLEGIIFTMMNKDNKDEIRMYKEFKKTFPEEVFFKTIIPHDSLFEKASFKSIPIGLLRGGQKAARPYLDLAMELKERELQTEGGIKDEDEGLF